jgi:hypothetical protein
MPSAYSRNRVSRTKRYNIGLVAALFFAVIAHACVASAGRVTGLIESGFDSFTEKYSIIEEDTLDDVTEFQTRIGLGYLQGDRFRNYFIAESRAVAGNNIYEGEGRLRLASSSGPNRFGVDMEGVVRRFRESTTYTFPNNYERYYLSAFFQRRLSPSLSVRVSERLERMDFEKTTEFDYDYWLNTVTISGDIESSLSSHLHAAVGYSYKAIPDTSEISHRAIRALCDYRHYPGIYRRIALSISAERRLYTHKPARSPFWEFVADMTLAPFAWGSWGCAAENYLESSILDRDTEVYFTYLENRSALLVTYNKSFDFQLRAGPSFAFFSSGGSEVDEYRETGAKIALEYARGVTMWVSCTYEHGWRSYQAYEEGDPESIFSDYSYDRLALFATARIRDRFGLNGFFNHEPERHKREGDDSSITLISFSLSYTF